jgi:hypothetical protein
MVARDGIEPPTPSFSGPLPMDLSSFESADPVETKAVSAAPISIVWDHLSWFLPQVVPVLFPRSSPLVVARGLSKVRGPTTSRMPSLRFLFRVQNREGLAHTPNRVGVATNRELRILLIVF